MFAILYDVAALDDLSRVRLFEARRIIDEVRDQLARAPTRSNRRRKRLEALVSPWEGARPLWQLRVGEFRVFYDVDDDLRQVVVRAVRRKGRNRTEEIR